MGQTDLLRFCRVISNSKFVGRFLTKFYDYISFGNSSSLPTLMSMWESYAELIIFCSGSNRCQWSISVSGVGIGVLSVLTFHTGKKCPLTGMLWVDTRWAWWVREFTLAARPASNHLEPQVTNLNMDFFKIAQNKHQTEISRDSS